MKITRLKALVRRPGFVAVEVDGARVAVLPVEEVRALGLGTGRILERSEHDRLLARAERAKAYDAAVRLLAIRGRSTQEIIGRLRRKGMRPDAVESAVGRLETDGVLDDARFAREFAHQHHTRGYGPVWILAALSRRGVERHAAERAVAALEADTNAEDRVVALARKRAARLRGLAPQTARRRLVGYLRRRGYSADQVLAALRQVGNLDGPESGAPPADSD